MKKLLGLLLYIVGTVIYIVFLTILGLNFGAEAGLYSLLSSLGAIIFVLSFRLL